MFQYARISVMAFEKRLCYILIVVLVLQSTGLIVVQFARCSPFEAQWNRHIPGAKCLSLYVVLNVAQSSIIFMDFTILLLPAFILRHLMLQWYQKLPMAAVLSFGGLCVSLLYVVDRIPGLHIPLFSACIFSLIRLTSLRASAQSTDITWDKFYSAIFGVIEPNMGIICSCTVTLRPLFQHHLPFLGRWLDGLSHPHKPSFSWVGRVGPAPTLPRSNTIEGSHEYVLATKRKVATVTETNSVET
jgi:hypothetical protein